MKSIARKWGPACAMLVIAMPSANALQYEVGVDLESGGSEASGVQSSSGAGTATWTFSSSVPVFVMVPLDDLLIPVSAHTSEYVLTDPNKGVFKFRDGKVASVSRIPLDIISTPNTFTRSVRPTLFVTIPGANLSGKGKENWQDDVARQGKALMPGRETGETHTLEPI